MNTDGEEAIYDEEKITVWDLPGQIPAREAAIRRLESTARTAPGG
jgi:hypothetical protein